MESWAPATTAFVSVSPPSLDDIASSSSATRSGSMAGTGGIFGMRDYRAAGCRSTLRRSRRPLADFPDTKHQAETNFFLHLLPHRVTLAGNVPH
jgi:hypothetical protein